MICLTLSELLHVAGRALGSEPEVRDYGLLESAAARPRASALGGDAYPGLDAKAAALLHSLASNHALADGSKRLALAGVIAFYGVNGRRLTLANDDACELIMSGRPPRRGRRDRHQVEDGNRSTLLTERP